jgi:hypothetical protein
VPKSHDEIESFLQIPSNTTNEALENMTHFITRSLGMFLRSEGIANRNNLIFEELGIIRVSMALHLGQVNIANWHTPVEQQL